jgi:glucosyl-3-phosphoglycerate synthase
MSFGVIQTFLSRLESLNILREMPELSSVMRQFQWRDSHYEQLENEIKEIERPPMWEIPAYQKKFGRHP